jgi:hypothetical protein
MTEQTTRVEPEGVCPVRGCTRPKEGSSFPCCKEHGRLYDAQAREEAWGFAESILRPWVEATRLMGIEELTRAMEVALREAEREYGRTLDGLEAAEASLG